MNSERWGPFLSSGQKLRYDDKEAKKCAACRDLTPSLRHEFRTGVQFTQLRHVYDQASRGCNHCKLLQTSLEAVDPENAQAALVSSGQNSSVDTKIFCEYLPDGGRNIRFEFVHPDYRLSITLYGIVDQPNPRKLGVSKPDQTSRDSTESVRAAKEWIQDCISQHPACGNGDPAPLPKRILDIGEHEDNTIHLRESLDKVAHYACLSYCWGSSQTVVTTTECLSEHIQGISIKSLPRTFRDAITFARRLGLRYLWIDSLCIIQNDEADWREEAAKMADYYSQSYVTIAATQSKSADGGLFQQQADNVLNDGNQAWSARAMRHLQRAGVSSAPLFQRGWIFQERLLSARVLHFTDHEMCFECNAHATCECKQDMPDEAWRMKQEYLTGTLVSPTGKSTPDLKYIWRRMVEEYCKLKLTKSADKLPALSGLANQIRSRRGSKYIAGLWDDSLLQDLTWRVAINHSDDLLPKLAPWRAPSWSWASVANAVRYNHANTYLHEEFCTIVHVDCSYLGPSTTGELASGEMVLRGPTFEGEVHGGRLTYEATHMKKHFNGAFYPDYRLGHEAFSVVVLRLGRNDRGLSCDYYLVLKPTDTGGTDFERVGLFQSSNSLASMWSKDDWTKAKECTVTII